MAAAISLLSAWPKAEMAGTAVKDARSDSGRPDPGAARAWEQVAALAAEIDTPLEAKAAALDPRTASATGEQPAGPWTQTHPHQALHAANQRQGRAVHQTLASGMGLRDRLPDI